MRAWIYLRKSRHLGDPDDPELLLTHRGILTRLAAADGIPVDAADIRAEIVSGERIEDRPAFSALLQLWERLPEGVGGVLYCMGFDRLSRGDPLERARVRVALRRAAIRIRTPSGSIDLADPDQALLAGVRSELAEHELARFKERIARARAEKLRRGEVLCGSAPFGYLWDKNAGLPLPNPQTFPILQACCKEVLTTSVARCAAKYGICTAVLQRALSNPAICGWAAKRHGLRVSKTGRRYPLPLPRSQWVWAESEGDWEAACTRGEWEAIQQALSSRRGRQEWTKTPDGWCRDVIRFEPAPPGAWVRLQSCGALPTYALIDPESRKRIADVGRAALNDFVTAALLPVLSDLDLLARALAAAAARRTADASGPPPERLRERIAQARQELQRLVRESLTAGEELQRARAAVQKELEEEIRALLRELQAREGRAVKSGDLPDPRSLLPLLEDPAAAWETLLSPLKRSLVNAMVVAVPVRFEREPHRHPQRTLLPLIWQPGVFPEIC